MKRILELLAVMVWMLALGALAGCSRGGREWNPSLAQGNQGSVASMSPACSLLDRNDIGATIGAGVAEGRAWGAGGLGCEWVAGDDKVIQLVVIDDSQYWQDLATTDGGESLPAVGTQAFVAPWLGNFRAGVLTTAGCIYVMTPRREASVHLLRAAASRLPARGTPRKT